MERIDNYTFDEESANPRELGRHRLSVTTLEKCDALAKLLRLGLRSGLWSGQAWARGPGQLFGLSTSENGGRRPG